MKLRRWPLRMEVSGEGWRFSMEVSGEGMREGEVALTVNLARNGLGHTSRLVGCRAAVAGVLAQVMNRLIAPPQKGSLGSRVRKGRAEGVFGVVSLEVSESGSGLAEVGWLVAPRSSDPRVQAASSMVGMTVDEKGGEECAALLAEGLAGLVLEVSK